MVDGILVFTTHETLIHKLQDGKSYESNYCYWEISKFPKKPVDKLYVAVKGIVRGYFKINSLKKNSTTTKWEIRFHSDSWVNVQDGEELKPSQGWRYYECQ